MNKLLKTGTIYTWVNRSYIYFESLIIFLGYNLLYIRESKTNKLKKQDTIQTKPSQGKKTP